jgi:hypothetical protein
MAQMLVTRRLLFGQCIGRSRSNGYSTSKRRWIRKVVTYMLWHFSFWFRILASGGAAIFGILGTWNLTSSELMRRNFFLGTSICWFALSCFFVHEAYKSKAASFDQEEESRFLLKESILDAITEDKEAREEICRACEILARLKDKNHAVPTVEPKVRRTSSTLTSLKRLATFSKREILDMITNREGSSSLGREAPQTRQADEEKKDASSETESYEI